MTIIQSLFSAVSGLRTASRSLQTSAANLANLQTSGFKKSRAVSSDVVSGGLQAQGGNLFLETAASGSPVTGLPGTSNAGNIISGVLETSNVDIAEEVVNQIVAKTVFKANANVIRTADEMIDTILDMKT